jgi:hypothetical protein
MTVQNGKPPEHMALEIFARAERLSRLAQLRATIAELQNDAALGRLIRTADEDKTIIDACDAMLSAIVWAQARLANLPDPSDSETSAH